MPVLAGGEGPKQGADASGKPYNQREANNSQYAQPGLIIGSPPRDSCWAQRF